jgi:hypothetical protein
LAACHGCCASRAEQPRQSRQFVLTTLWPLKGQSITPRLKFDTPIPLKWALSGPPWPHCRCAVPRAGGRARPSLCEGPPRPPSAGRVGLVGWPSAPGGRSSPRPLGFRLPLHGVCHVVSGSLSCSGLPWPWPGRRSALGALVAGAGRLGLICWRVPVAVPGFLSLVLGCRGGGWLLVAGGGFLLRRCLVRLVWFVAGFTALRRPVWRGGVGCVRAGGFCAWRSGCGDSCSCCAVAWRVGARCLGALPVFWPCGAASGPRLGRLAGGSPAWVGRCSPCGCAALPLVPGVGGVAHRWRLSCWRSWPCGCSTPSGWSVADQGGIVAVAGSRTLPPQASPLVAAVCRSVLRSGRSLAVGCAVGADAAVLGAGLPIGAVRCFAAFGPSPSFAGSWRGSAAPVVGRRGGPPAPGAPGGGGAPPRGSAAASRPPAALSPGGPVVRLPCPCPPAWPLARRRLWRRPRPGWWCFSRLRCRGVRPWPLRWPWAGVCQCSPFRSVFRAGCCRPLGRVRGFRFLALGCGPGRFSGCPLRRVCFELSGGYQDGSILCFRRDYSEVNATA